MEDCAKLIDYSVYSYYISTHFISATAPCVCSWQWGGTVSIFIYSSSSLNNSVKFLTGQKGEIVILETIYHLKLTMDTIEKDKEMGLN